MISSYWAQNLRAAIQGADREKDLLRQLREAPGTDAAVPKLLVGLPVSKLFPVVLRPLIAGGPPAFGSFGAARSNGARRIEHFEAEMRLPWLSISFPSVVSASGSRSAIEHNAPIL